MGHYVVSAQRLNRPPKGDRDIQPGKQTAENVNRPAHRRILPALGREGERGIARRPRFRGWLAITTDDKILVAKR